MLMVGGIHRPKDVTDSNIIIKLVHHAKSDKKYRAVRIAERGTKRIGAWSQVYDI